MLLLNQERVRVKNRQITFNPRMTPNCWLKECDVIFPVVPSESFPEMIQKFSSYLRPYHILIHGTKGLYVSRPNWEEDGIEITGEDICTMSKLIRKESLVVRIGCLAGPNLAKELADNQPAATVVARSF